MRIGKRMVFLRVVIVFLLLIPGLIWKNPTNIMRFIYLGILLSLWTKIGD